MIWQKYITDPTFIVVETTNYSTSKIPFPAVTVCDTERVFGPNTDNITNILKHRNFDDDQIAEFYSSFTAISNVDYSPSDYVKKMHKALQDLGYTFEGLLELFSKPCEVLLVRCMWRSHIQNCSDMFREVNTVVGICCQFDMDFFRENAAPGTNFEAGLETTEALGVTVSGQKVSHRGSTAQGYVWLYVYDEDLDITILDAPKTLTPAGFFDVHIHTWLTVASSDVEELPVDKRRCFLKSEFGNGVTYYQACMANHILRKVVNTCRCLPFSYSANKLRTEEYPKCIWERYMCVFKTIKDVMSNIKHIIDENECLLRCNYVQYETVIEYIKNQRTIDRIDDSFSTVVVHYSSSTCFKYKREVIYSWDQMLANLGGIFGLCLGGSTISLLELAWFMIDFLASLFRSTRKTKIVPKKKHVFTLSEENVLAKVHAKYDYVN